MLVVLAHPRDGGAATLVDRWRARGRSARLMVPRDLSVAGWRHHVGGHGQESEASFVAGGERLPTGALAGVVTRLPAIHAPDLPHIATADREYVATEMNAFLTSWLTSLRCPVLNRPAATSLMGQNRSRERWAQLAAGGGLRLAAHRSVAPGDGNAALAKASATVIGGRWFGAVAPELGAQAVRLAEHAGLDLCTAQFDGADRSAAFVCAELGIDVASDDVADALLARLDGRAA